MSQYVTGAYFNKRIFEGAISLGGVYIVSIKYLTDTGKCRKFRVSF
jgi:hypothetical protein